MLRCYPTSPNPQTLHSAPPCTTEDPNEKKAGLWIWGLFEEPLYPCVPPLTTPLLVCTRPRDPPPVLFRLQQRIMYTIQGMVTLSREWKSFCRTPNKQTQQTSLSYMLAYFDVKRMEVADGGYHIPEGRLYAVMPLELQSLSLPFNRVTKKLAVRHSYDCVTSKFQGDISSRFEVKKQN